MPSANPKLEKQASTEATDPIRQAIIVIEHKIRNLEKRKGKLEGYRDLQKSGRELDKDQKTAVAKYDEVLQTLDITRDLYKAIVGIANDSVKQQKKLARKEALERTQQDIAKVREVLLIQDILNNIGAEVAREDFLSGSNGATKLTEEDLKFLDDLYNEITAKRHPETPDTPFPQQLQKAAEHYIAIIEGKQREFVGTTYLKLKEIITSVNQCGYFDQAPVQETETTIEVTTETVSELRVNDAPETTDDYTTGDVHIPPPESMIPMPNFPVQVTPVPVATAPGPIPVVPQAIPPHPAPVDANYYGNTGAFVPPQSQTQPPAQAQPPRINDVIGGTPNFFFLQESELDAPEVSSQQPIVTHIPPVNAPIPTQTFTNQSFSGAPVQVPQQVIYSHPPQDISHIPGFANPNPPPPIPMPPSHQGSMQYSPQHPAGYQGQGIQGYEGVSEAEAQIPGEDKGEQRQEDPSVVTADVERPNETVDWCQMTDNTPMNEWNSADVDQQQSGQQESQSGQQAWGEQRSGYRGRGGRRGNSNGYNGRGRGSNGGYQQNGRGSGQANYYRHENNYQNGYQRNYHNDGNTGGYNGNFKRAGGGGGTGGGTGGSRGGPRAGERTGMDRGRGGQFRGQRGGNRGGYAPRSNKPQAQQ
ncbi:caprin homolog [Diachasma alloeum]|uniref:caprin homolog n=1 Tax=Diachasma alloeum TaxID=454923 RepID=UPI000738133C|nr:caprin homolog [Diachasma alloeum]